MPRTPLRCLDAALLALAVVAAVPAAASAAASAMPLSCTLTAPARFAAGEPVRLQFALHNGGAQPVQLLVWGTPFEPAWFAPYVTVTRNGAALPYGGAMMKRGEPTAAQYLPVDAGQSRSAIVELAPVFDVKVPGHYRVEPQIVLHDLLAGGAAGVPRLRAMHVQRALPCNAVEFEVAP